MKKYFIFSLIAAIIVAFAAMTGCTSTKSASLLEEPDDFKMNQRLVQIMKALDQSGASIVNTNIYGTKLKITRTGQESFQVDANSGMFSYVYIVHFSMLNLAENEGLVHIAKLESFQNGKLLRRFIFKPFFDEKRPLIYESGRIETRNFLSAYEATLLSALKGQPHQGNQTAKTF